MTLTKTLYILAYSWRGTQIEIEDIIDPVLLLKRLNELTEWDEKPDVNADPIKYLQRYYTWIAEENQNKADTQISLLVLQQPYIVYKDENN